MRPGGERWVALLLATVALACPVASSAPAAGRAPQALVPAETPAEIADGRGFTPAALTLAKGGPGAFVFRRTTYDTCATAVVFPELGLEHELPVGVDVALRLRTAAARSCVFQCGMGMYRSRVVVR